MGTRKSIVATFLFEPEEWRNLAGCRSYSGSQYDDWWFPASTTYADPEALAICMACPVREECKQSIMRIEQGLKLHERFGFQAGMTRKQRYHLAKKEAL